MLRTKMMKMAATVAATTAVICTSAFAANVVSTTDVNVRSGPDNSYAVLTVMRKGTSSEKLGMNGNWVKVKVNGKTGYVYKSFLKEDAASAETPTEKKTVSITASSLNIRSGPGTKYDIIGAVKKGKTVTVVGTNGDWYKIEYNGKDGYINKKYTKDQTKTVTITANSLNVRSGPGTKYNIIGKLKKGSTAVAVEKSGDWYKIQYGKGYGYIHVKYTK